MLAVLLAGLLFAMAPNAIADSENVTVETSLQNAPEKGWYASGEIVEIAASLVNDGDATSIIVDPSCDQYLKVWKQSTLVLDESVNCLGQSRGMDLGAFSTTQMNTLTWDLTDSEGEIVPSGDYTIEYIIAGEDISSTLDIHVQTPTNVPEGLAMELIATARDGVHSQSSPTIISVRLHNSLNENMELQFEECRLVINYELYNSCGPDLLMPNQIITIAQIPFSPEIGVNEYTVSLGDEVLSQTISFEAIGDFDDGIMTGDYGNLELSLLVEGDKEFGEMEDFSSQISIKNNGVEDVSLEFTDVCRAETWVIDSAGNVVMDTRSIKDCSEMAMENLLTPGEEKTYTQPDWVFIDNEGCHVPPGELLVIMEIPEHDLYSTDTISLIRDRDSYCENEDMNVVADISGEDTLTITPSIVSSDYNDLTWFTICGLKSTLIGPEGVVDEFLSQCDYNSMISLKISDLELEDFEIDMAELDEGQYSIMFETYTAPRIKSTIAFDWPIVLDEEEVVEDDVEEDVEIVSRFVEGSWSATSNDLGTCWLLNSPDEGILTLSGAPGVISWTPEVGANGQYMAYDSEPSPECSDFAATAITVEEVISQQSESIPDEEIEEEIVISTVENNEDEISPIVISAGIVVASGGILSLLVALIASNETWRIPTTSAGLWLLGLIGRTSETSDGRYQRGRLIGYLTANPGCHFRALMAALEMSNGQITHHLKILEDEDRIWRRPDGRLVRFYPFTNNLHPGIQEEDLPLPPLSPDPNSLQGKILRLLDDDGQMNKSPTQAELAHRLDRSQQLVSHHLRTLQKFGLVEKQKKGVKNRYCLTKEAVFLLDTTEL